MSFFHNFRVRKRDTESASLGEVSTNLKKHRTGSDNILETVDESGDDDEVLTAESTASESGISDIHHINVATSRYFPCFSMKLASMAQSVHLIGNQEVTGSIPTGSGNILLWRLIMKYFLHMVILSLTQEGQLAVSGERMCTNTG